MKLAIMGAYRQLRQSVTGSDSKRTPALSDIGYATSRWDSGTVDIDKRLPIETRGGRPRRFANKTIGVLNVVEGLAS
jgi:hypothetical protein